MRLTFVVKFNSHLLRIYDPVMEAWRIDVLGVIIIDFLTIFSSPYLFNPRVRKMHAMPEAILPSFNQRGDMDDVSRRY